ncbi:MAG: hypothetical protein Q7T79_00535 [bacterium]|nr:hypothetical protein [bacterium]
MTKHKLLYIILVCILLIVSCMFFVYPKFQKNSTPSNATIISHLSLDGHYVFDTKNPLQDSNVEISNSSEKEISYNISTVNFGHLGGISGIAKRTASSSLVYENILESEIDGYKTICSVVISFNDINNLSYNISGEGCEYYHGAHGTFFNDEIHKKNGSVSLPTIEKLGFTKEDLVQFHSLFKNSDYGFLLGYAQGFIDLEIANIKKIISSDIPNTIGYSIETPNVYNGATFCFSDSEEHFGGDCTFVIFMKDNNNNYWLLEGSNYGDNFCYATNNLQWKKKLPIAFQSELNRIGISKDAVKFLP